MSRQTMNVVAYDSASFLIIGHFYLEGREGLVEGRIKGHLGERRRPPSQRTVVVDTMAGVAS